MTSDIVTRLRNSYGQGCTCFAHHSFECSCVGAQWVERYVDEAADEIERLRGEVEGWREAVDYCHSIIDMLRKKLAEHRLPGDGGDNTISNQTS